MKTLSLLITTGALLFMASETFATPSTISLSLSEAESRALSASDQLKSSAADQKAAASQADAQFQYLLPKLSLTGNYTYYNAIPQITIFGTQPINFGTNSVYSLGPVLNYTLWDTFASRNAYAASSTLAAARAADHESASLQVLYNTRMAYVQVQLGLEELILIYNSLQLARAQDRDVSIRLRAGAASRLDRVTSQRSVLSYQIQFKQRQAELASSIRDLMTLLKDDTPYDLSKPGPDGVPTLTLALKLETLDSLLAKESSSDLIFPGDAQPQIRSQELQAKASDLSAKSTASAKYPKLDLTGGVTYNRPNIPNPIDYWQEYVGLTLTFPLFLGDPSRAQAASQRSQAESAWFRASQTRNNLERDFKKAQDLLTNLKDQQQLAFQDVQESQEQAKLYYAAYKVGKINLIDVQSANNQALQSKVNLARIVAQILNQIVTLKSISGEGHPL